MLKPPEPYYTTALKFYGLKATDDVTDEQVEKVARLGWSLRNAKKRMTLAWKPKKLGGFFK